MPSFRINLCRSPMQADVDAFTELAGPLLVEITSNDREMFVELTRAPTPGEMQQATDLLATLTTPTIVEV